MKIDGTNYNVEAIKNMGFKEFSKLHNHYSEEKLKNVWYQLTGEDLKKEQEKPAKEKTDTKS